MDALPELPAAVVPTADPPIGLPDTPAPPLVRARIHALRPGTFPADPMPLTVSVDDLIALAAAYDPTRYQAPVVIGHPLTDDPAWGWVLDAAVGDTGLWLEVELLPEMAELVQAGSYRTVSVALWTPNAPGNPAPGVWSLKHLGFLGAQPPAVKGLAAVRLNNDAGTGITIITCEELTNMITPDTASAAVVALHERETAINARETALNRREAELRLAGYRGEIEQHVAAGRVTAAEVEPLALLMERLTGTATITLSEGDTPALDVLRQHLARLPARVTLGEHAAPTPLPTVALPKIPHGYRLSEAGLDLHSRAVAHQATHHTDYLTAVRAVQAHA